jgi:hypothetical protein
VGRRCPGADTDSLHSSGRALGNFLNIAFFKLFAEKQQKKQSQNLKGKKNNFIQLMR